MSQCRYLCIQIKILGPNENWCCLSCDQWKGESTNDLCLFHHTGMFQHSLWIKHGLQVQIVQTLSFSNMHGFVKQSAHTCRNFTTCHFEDIKANNAAGPSTHEWKNKDSYKIHWLIILSDLKPYCFMYNKLTGHFIRYACLTVC